jgi:hypothetical protein
MLDLDWVWSEDDELYCRLGELYLKHLIRWDYFYKLTNFFGIYIYVIPAHRVTNYDLQDALYFWHRKRPFGLRSLHLGMSSACETCFTERHQLRILELIRTNKFDPGLRESDDLWYNF